MTLKEIALELLQKYQASETSCIWELSGDISESEKWLSSEVQKYRELIEASAQLEHQWVPCSERPPEGIGTYMTTIDYGKYGLAVGQRYYHGALGWEDECVVAWMPLPEPYKIDRKGEENE